MSWMDGSEKEILVAYENHLVKVYSTKLRAFTSGFSIDAHPGKLMALYPCPTTSDSGYDRRRADHRLHLLLDFYC